MRGPTTGVMLVVAAWVACTPLAAGEPLRGAGPLRVESFPLDSSTTVALVEDHRAPLVALRIAFPAGDWSPWGHERHLREAFEIQLDDSAGELRADADRLAAGISLAVGDRSTQLRARCLRDDLPQLLDLIREIFSNDTWDRSELRRMARGRRLSWSAAQRNPFFVGWQAAARELYGPDDPRRRRWEKPEAAETRASRLAATRDALLGLRGRVIGFAGDLTRAEAAAAARELLPPAGEQPPSGLGPVFGAATTQTGEIVVSIPKLTQVYFGYGRESLTYHDPDYPAFLVADHVLGGHFYSRLYRALRHEGGETYSAHSVSYGDTVAGPYRVSTYTRLDNAEAVDGKLREVLRRFHEQGITETERASAVGALVGRRRLSRQSPVQVLDRHLRERALGLTEGFLDDLVDRAARLALDEVNAFIARWYAPRRFSMVRVEPR